MALGSRRLERRGPGRAVSSAHKQAFPTPGKTSFPPAGSDESLRERSPSQRREVGTPSVPHLAHWCPSGMPAALSIPCSARRLRMHRDGVDVGMGIRGSWQHNQTHINRGGGVHWKGECPQLFRPQRMKPLRWMRRGNCGTASPKSRASNDPDPNPILVFRGRNYPRHPVCFPSVPSFSPSSS